MATPVIVPSLGQSVTHGSIGKWLKKRGDLVRFGESLLEVETEKATVEIYAPIGGRLQAISAAPGATVEVGTKIAEVDETSAKPGLFDQGPAGSVERPKSWLSRLLGQ